jgi:hypothetical protein
MREEERSMYDSEQAKDAREEFHMPTGAPKRYPKLAEGEMKNVSLFSSLYRAILLVISVSLQQALWKYV